MMNQFIRAAALAKDGFSVAGAALIRAGMAAIYITWVASLSSQDAGNFGLAMAIFASLSSLSMGFTVLAQVRFAGAKSGDFSSSDEGVNLIWAAVFCGLLTTIIVCLFTSCANILISNGTRWLDVLNILWHLAFSYPAIYGSSVLAMGFIATKRNKYILYGSSLVGICLVAIIGTAKLLNVKITAVAIADATVFIAYLTFAIYARIDGISLIKPHLTKLLIVLRGSKEFVLWPSLEQFSMLGIMAMWQSVVAESSPDVFNAISVAMGVFGLYRALVRGVSQIGSIRVREQVNSSNISEARICVQDITGAAVLSCTPLLLIGILFQTELSNLLNWHGDVDQFSFVVTTLALSMAIDAVASTLANILQVLKKGRFVFACDVGLSAVIALGGTLIFSIFHLGGLFVGVIALASYQCVACCIYVFAVMMSLQNQTSYSGRKNTDAASSAI